MTRTELIATIKQLNITTEKPAHQMKSEVLEKLIQVHGPIEMEVKSNRGRKPNPESARQHRLAARVRMMEEGITPKRGRKKNPTSARQQRLALWAAKKAAGEVVRRGRPKSISA
jgi:hypothetical protein